MVKGRCSPSDFSIVVASTGSQADLVRCLDALLSETQHERPPRELIVARHFTREAENLAMLRQRFPCVTFAVSEKANDVFQLRSLGIRGAAGDAIVLLEDHCIVPPGWWNAMLESYEAGTFGGGSIVPFANGNLRQFALFCVEFAQLLPQREAREPIRVCGAHAVYPRSGLEDCFHNWRDGFFENEVQDWLIENGRLPAAPLDAVVHSGFDLTFRESLQHMFTGGLRYGRYRSGRIGKGERLLWILGSPLIPMLLFGRIARAIFRWRPAALLGLAVVTPRVLANLVAWALGEAVGAICRPSISEWNRRAGEPRTTALLRHNVAVQRPANDDDAIASGQSLPGGNSRGKAFLLPQPCREEATSGPRLFQPGQQES